MDGEMMKKKEGFIVALIFAISTVWILQTIDIRKDIFAVPLLFFFVLLYWAFIEDNWIEKK